MLYLFWKGNGKIMKRVIAEYPYNDYYLYVVFHKNEGRQYANLIPIDESSGLKRKTISYARYLMSVKEGRILNEDEHVDHKDDDKTNDDINNLQILSLRENNIKEAKRRGLKMVVLKCPYCGTIFEKRKRDSFLQNNRLRYNACSKHCAAKFSALLQFHPNDPKLLQALKENVINEYIKHE